MVLRRVIPVLLYSNAALRKTKKFERPKYIGDAVNAVRLFNDLGADELIVLDIDASKAGAGPNMPLIDDLASECFMPLTYGGGVSSVAGAEALFSRGIEKVSINHSALADTSLITKLANAFGSSSVVVAVDVKKNMFGRQFVYSHVDRKITKLAVLEYLKRAEALGAGEILLTSVDREGTQKGMDLDLISQASQALDIPLVAHGGCGRFDHITDAFLAGASGVAAGSKFVFEGPHNAVLINYLSTQEYDRINGGSNSYD